MVRIQFKVQHFIRSSNAMQTFDCIGQLALVLTAGSMIDMHGICQSQTVPRRRCLTLNLLRTFRTTCFHFVVCGA